MLTVVVAGGDGEPPWGVGVVGVVWVVGVVGVPPPPPLPHPSAHNTNTESMIEARSSFMPRWKAKPMPSERRPGTQKCQQAAATPLRGA